jgi:hypothetical protein
MTDRSILAAVQCCDACGQHFHLCVGHRSRLAREVAHLRTGLVHCLKQVPPMHHCIGHQTKRAMDICTGPPARAGTVAVQVRVLVRSVLRRQCRHPRKVRNVGCPG